MTGGRGAESGAARRSLGNWPGAFSSSNPFVGVLAADLERRGWRCVSIDRLSEARAARLDALILHWPEYALAHRTLVGGVFAALKLGWRLYRLHAANVRLIWIVHNLQPHELRGPGGAFLWRRTLAALPRLLDGYVTLSPGTLPLVARAEPRFGGVAGAWGWHPVYPDARIGADERAAARAKLGVDDGGVLIGSFGGLRGYKGYEQLLAAFRGLADPRLRLVFGGRAAGARTAAFADRLQAEIGGDDRITLIRRFLPDDEYRTLVNACDVCVFPYNRYMHSGAMIYALSAGRRVLASETPFSRSLAAIMPDGVVDLYRGPLSADILARAAAADNAAEPDLARFEDATLADAIESLLATSSGRK